MKVYINSDHLKDWKYHVERCNRDESLSESERNEIRFALEFLEKELGEDFLGIMPITGMNYISIWCPNNGST